MYLWPVPSDPFVQMTVWTSRQIQDVGDLQDELEVPQRWYEAVIFMLAHRMALELPGVAMDRIGYLEKMANEYLNEAEQEERDKSPIYFAPNIAPYTR
jgi:lauroyl/myristoyl acyltransferase